MSSLQIFLHMDQVHWMNNVKLKISEFFLFYFFKLRWRSSRTSWRSRHRARSPWTSASRCCSWCRPCSLPPVPVRGAWGNWFGSSRRTQCRTARLVFSLSTMKRRSHVIALNRKALVAIEMGIDLGEWHSNTRMKRETWGHDYCQVFIKDQGQKNCGIRWMQVRRHRKDVCYQLFLIIRIFWLLIDVCEINVGSPDACMCAFASKCSGLMSEAAWVVARPESSKVSRGD